METKNEALELAAEIERLRDDCIRACKLVADMHMAAMGGVIGPVLGVVEDVAALRAERDQLKAKNEKLVSAVETVCEGFTLHPSARKILETGLYGEAPKENT